MLGRSKTDALFYAPRKNTRGASCFWNPVYTSRALDCMHAAYVFATYSQPTGKCSWLAQGVSVGAFAAAASLLFGVLKHDTLFLSASADRFLYRRCNLWIKDTAATNYISINARMGHIVHRPRYTCIPRLQERRNSQEDSFPSSVIIALGLSLSFLEELKSMQNIWLGYSISYMPYIILIIISTEIFWVSWLSKLSISYLKNNSFLLFRC